MTLLIIRHGETPLNVARVLQPAATPLSARGQAQAAALAERLAAAQPAALRQSTDLAALRPSLHPAALRPVAIVSSDLPRALQTAQAIGTACGLAVHTSVLLHERNFGQWRGLAYDSLGFDPLSNAEGAPGGESLADFKARCQHAWAWVLAQHAALGGPLAVVTHGLVIRTWLQDGPLAVPTGMALPHGLANTSLTVADSAPPHTVQLLDYTSHLAGGVGEDAASLSGG